jgi:hypothetical protein
MCSLTCVQLKPSYYKRYATKLTVGRRTWSSYRVRSSLEPYRRSPNPKTRFAEVLNGRSAMQGVLWGSLNWVMTGENVIQQIEDPVYAITASGVVTALAWASMITSEKINDETFGVFTPEAELKNGRLAMLGFIALCGLSAM